MDIEIASPNDEPRLCRLLSLAFGFTADRSREYLGHVGLDAVSVLRDADGVIALAALIPTAHVIGGRAVPAVNIAHVALDPGARGRGLGVAFVNAICERACSNGAGMVSLFASSRPVYRRCGFGLAGHEIVYEARTSALPKRSHVTLEEVDPDDPRVHATHERKSLDENGYLVRHAAHWAEIRRAPSDGLATYLGADSYVTLDTADPGCLHVRDWSAPTTQAAQNLLAFLGGFATVFPRVRWHGGPSDELVAALPDKGWRIAYEEKWLARIVDPASAFEARGFNCDHGAVSLCITGSGEVGTTGVENPIATLALTVRAARGRCQVVADNSEAVRIRSIGPST